jgi:hypothetical protein
MGQELAQVMCPECGVPGESDPQLSRWQCSKCGNAFFLRRCSACARVSYVDGLQGFHTPWPCTWCGQFNSGFSQNRDPAAASAAELAAELARRGLPRPVAGAGQHGAVAQVPVGVPRRRGRRAALLIAVAGACAATAFFLVAAGSPRAAGMAARQRDGGVTRAVHVSAGRVHGIDLSGVPGQLTITGTRSSQVVLTGQLQGAGSAPAVSTRFDRAGHVLVVSFRCAPGSPCTENLQLEVPAGIRVALRQPSGRVVVSGLAGPLSIAAGSADITATGLRSPDLAAVITSGHLSAAFVTPPRRVSITLASAQATLRLPARAAYRVTQEVTSGYVDVAIPQAASASRAVIARIDSGELELLPS